MVLVGRALRLAPWFSGSSKCYEGTIRFGIETDTLDPEGTISAEGPVPVYEALEAVLPRFRGNIVQVPPEYSAIHIGGKRASALVRAGAAVEMLARPVTIYELELLAYEPPLARIRVTCSSGTYIRSLARDIARAAGSCAHLVALTRTHVSGFLCADADAAILHPIDTAAFETLGLPVFFVDETMVDHVIHGRTLYHFMTGQTATSAAGLFRLDGTLLAVVKQNDAGQWQYGYVYAHN